MGEVKAFAVSAEPLARREAMSPNSSDWTLYDPDRLAEMLGLPPDDVDAALVQTGFNKAVRIREEIIRWKERLRHEEVALQTELRELNEQRRKVGRRLAVVQDTLANVRNLLRIPREKPES